MIAKRKARGGNVLLLLSGFLLVLLAVGWLGWGPVLERFARMKTHLGTLDVDRFVYWKDSVNILKEFPATGSGFGTFAKIYPSQRTVAGPMFVNHAHNDYLELLTNGGITAFALIAWFLLALVVKTYGTFLKRRELYSVYLYLGALTGIVALLLHSFVDFSFQNGANGLYFFLLAGLLVSAANTRLRGSRATNLRPVSLRFPRLSLSTGILAVVCLLVLNVSFSRGAFYEALIKNSNDKYLARSDLLRLRDLAQKAVVVDPLSAEHHYVLAGIENRLAPNSLAALEQYTKAVQLDPANSQYLQELGVFLAGLGKEGQADALLRAGIRHDPNNPLRYKHYAAWLLAAGEKEKAAAIIRATLSTFQNDETIIKEYIALMILNRWTTEEIRGALPGRALPFVCLAEYMKGVGKSGGAGEMYETGLAHLQDEEQPPLSVFWRMWGYYQKTGQDEKALEVVRKGLESYPNHRDMHLAAARLYEKLNINYRAVEEYRHALVLDPGNLVALEQLARLQKQ